MCKEGNWTKQKKFIRPKGARQGRGQEGLLRMAMGRWWNPLSAINSIAVGKKTKKPRADRKSEIKTVGLQGTSEQQLQEMNCFYFFLFFPPVAQIKEWKCLHHLRTPTPQSLMGTYPIVPSLKKLRQGIVMLIWQCPGFSWRRLYFSA